MKAFVPKFLLFSALIAILLQVWNMYSPETIHSLISWPIYLFFALSTLLVHAQLLKAEQKGGAVFVRQFMGITTLKLFVYLLFIIVIFLIDRDQAKVITIYFLTMYFAFTVFEVSSLYKKLRK